MAKGQNRKPAGSGPGRRMKRGWILGGAATLAAVILAFAFFRTPEQELPLAPAPHRTNAVASAAVPTAAPGRLVGRWQRPDGGYVLEFREAAPSGRLSATYFNPNQVNVSTAGWTQGQGGLEVFVELRDVNYPGATYKLRYFPEPDLLAGEYFQPAYQQTYQVQFERVRP